MKYSKPPQTDGDLLAHWEKNGLQVSDVGAAKAFLRFVGYYRLKAYALPLRDTTQPGKPFQPGSTFEQIRGFYEFDHELRLLTIDALGRMEVGVRSVFINTMSNFLGDPFWLLDPSHFKVPLALPNVSGPMLIGPAFRHADLIRKLEAHLSIDPQRLPKAPFKVPSELFLKHYYSKYGDPYLPPAWMIGEVLTMGDWSRMYEALKSNLLRKAIARPFKVPEPVLESWLHALTQLRNFCAHHARVWNRQFAIRPATAKKHAMALPTSAPGGDRYYAMAFILKDLLDQIVPGHEWHQRLDKLLTAYPLIRPATMGFPANWRTESFWGLAAPVPNPS